MRDPQSKNRKYFHWLGLSMALFFLSFVAFHPQTAEYPLYKTSAPTASLVPAIPCSNLLTNISLAPATYPPAPQTPISPLLTTSFSLSDSSKLNILYENLNLDSLGMSLEAFHKAITGFLSMVTTGTVPNPGILSIIDFSLPSTQKRLFILDLFNGRLLFNSLVAHGRNSGKLIANRFSNRFNSYMSSLGFYLTGEPFIGQHGYSLRLDGQEKGWNDNVHRRSIIMHPADYVSEAHIRQWGYLGRSEGCPAIPEELDRSIIDIIRGGSCLFVYSPDKKYLKRSKLFS